MPEAVDLPHTWRPFGARIAVIFFGAMLFILCAFAWFGLDPEIRAKFTVLQLGTIVFIGLLYVAAGYAIARSRVVASEAGVHVVNGYKQRDYEWAEIIAIHLPAGAPWATIDPADGTTASMLAIRGLRRRPRACGGPDPAHAHRSLNLLVDVTRRTPPTGEVCP
ncbi:PH domain-containing protein [Nocardioides sp. B-3]|uniref:PH domain-containing protein n=1 Tax=Nocardioides sp. B-3 TaxID=2895565 RepID=UPI0021524158|nr:PH domain-containing protein [Nocardioides sp. B-3]UUZ58976.1 PH domain-containing protein [Nocardioides sp. B-3]